MARLGAGLSKVLGGASAFMPRRRISVHWNASSRPSITVTASIRVILESGRVGRKPPRASGVDVAIPTLIRAWSCLLR
jgi:hypothetical protein